MSPRHRIIRLDFSYDGSHFKGYQRQKTERTVQGEIESVLQQLYKEEIETICAGRTDTGVHAYHQVISFVENQIVIPPKRLKVALNALLPQDIRVLDCSYTHPKFHARFSAKRRTYCYQIYTGKDILPFQTPYFWHWDTPLSWKKMKKASKLFVGEHDFSAFCEKPASDNRVRTIYKMKMKKKKNILLIEITGNAFLRRMIRIIVGTLVGVASSEAPPEIISSLLQEKLRGNNPFPTAPPRGLFLKKIEF